MKIAFKNLRSLKSTGEINIKPLTILLGQNSSGKSTFLRSLPLIKQSIESRTTGPVLWYGRFVDFGQFKDAISQQTTDKHIEFQFEFNPLTNFRRHFYHERNHFLAHQTSTIKKLKAKLHVQATNDSENLTYCSLIGLKFNGFTAQITVNKKSEIEGIMIDDHVLDMTKMSAINTGNLFFPKIYVKSSDGVSYFGTKRYIRDLVNIQIRDIAKTKLVEDTINKITHQFKVTSNEDLLQSIKNANGSKKFTKAVSNWNLEDANYGHFKATILFGLVCDLIEASDNFIHSLAENINYVAPLRATAERYYRPQDLSVDEVDFQGKNLALVLNNLSSHQKKQFEEWCTKTFGFHPKIQNSGGNLTINIKFKGGTLEHNIADLGFGFSQILPIVTQIWLGSIRNIIRLRRFQQIKIYAIEQPELHLHPSLQGKLVNALLNVIQLSKKNELNIHFIIETHSETIINAIGTRIYDEKIKASEVNVLLFEKETPDSHTKIRTVSYTSDGRLKNWPYGFFHEVDQL